MLRGLVCAAVAMISFMPQTARAAIVTIPDGTEIRVRLQEDLSSATASLDDKVRFQVVDDVIIKGRTVITAGSQAWGTVKEVSRKKSFGRSGKLDFTISYIRVDESQTIRLAGRRTRQGDNNYLKAGAASYLVLPLGLAIKGKDITLPAGTEYVVYVDGDRRIEMIR